MPAGKGARQAQVVKGPYSFSPYKAVTVGLSTAAGIHQALGPSTAAGSLDPRAQHSSR